jgi:hydrogenase/urease accessory protein HupE
MILAALLICLTSSPVHPGSFSRSVVTVDGTSIQHSLRVQALTVIETLPIDMDGDLILGAEELESGREEICWYLDQNYRFFPNEVTGSPMKAKLLGFELVLDGSPDLPTNFWIHADFEYAGDTVIETLTVEELLFETSNPQHIEYASVSWGDEEPSHYIFSGTNRRETFEPTGRARRGPVHVFFDMGVEHILSGWDHLLFLIALLVGARSIKSLIAVVTAFTVAHSITLALAARDLVSLPSSFVELAIALSIVYVAAENLLKLEKRSLWIEAFFFGLLHGLGFAGFLSDALRGQDQLLLPLIGFNAGVEVGQVLVVIPIALIFHLISRRAAPDESGSPRLVPRPIGNWISVVVIAVGLYWFAERAGFIA